MMSTFPQILFLSTFPKSFVPKYKILYIHPPPPKKMNDDYRIKNNEQRELDESIK